MYRTLKNKLLSSTFSKNLAIVLSGNIAAKTIGILSAPIITRLYTPEDYGVFAIFVSIVAIVGSLSTLRYAVTIPLQSNEQAAEDMVKLCLLISLVISLSSWVVVISVGDDLAKAFEVEKIVPYLWVLPLAFFFAGAYQTFSNWAVREKHFKLITRTALSQGITSSAGKIGLGLLGVKPLGLLVGLLLQEAAGVITLLRHFLKKRPSFFQAFDYASIKSQAVRYRKFPLIQSWSQLLLALGAQLPVLLVGYYFGLKAAGVFGLAQSMISLPMNLIGQSVSQVYYAEIAKFGKNQPEKIYHLSISVIKKMFFLGLIPALFLLFLGPLVFELVFGDEWKEAGVYSQMLTGLILFRFVSSPIASVLNVFEKQWLQFNLNAIRVVLVILVFYCSSFMGLLVKETVLFFGVAVSVYYILLIAIILMLTKRQKRKSFVN